MMIDITAGLFAHFAVDANALVNFGINCTVFAHSHMYAVFGASVDTRKASGAIAFVAQIIHFYCSEICLSKNFFESSIKPLSLL